MQTSVYVGILFAVILRATDAQITGWAAPPISGASGTSSESITVSEDAANLSTVYTFLPIPSEEFYIYQLLTPGTPFSLFIGILSVFGTLDYETTSSYVIEVSAMGDDGFGTATVTVTVTDVNEAIPAFGQTSYDVCAVDGSTAGTSVTTFSATDPDPGSNITYTIFTGNTNTDFKVSIAELQVNTGKTLNMSTTVNYTLVIHATDETGRSGSATFTVHVESSCSSEAAALIVTNFILLLALAFIASLNIMSKS